MFPLPLIQNYIPVTKNKKPLPERKERVYKNIYVYYMYLTHTYIKIPQFPLSQGLYPSRLETILD